MKIVEINNVFLIKKKFVTRLSVGVQNQGIVLVNLVETGIGVIVLYKVIHVSLQDSARTIAPKMVAKNVHMKIHVVEMVKRLTIV